jgi:nicotinamidase-related amidase
LRIDTDEAPIIEDTQRMALVVVDMQNDFCSEGGWADKAGFDVTRGGKAIPGIERTIAWAREYAIRVIWIGWANRQDLRNLGSSTLHQYKKTADMTGIGESVGDYCALLAGTWGTEFIDKLEKLRKEDDIVVDKFRDNGFYGTQLDQILRAQGLSTLFFTGINTDQCVATTMEEASIRDYNVVLLEDATATSNPDFCKEAILLNTRQCWGFVSDTERLQHAVPTQRAQRDAKAKD